MAKGTQLTPLQLKTYLLLPQDSRSVILRIHLSCHPFIPLVSLRRFYTTSVRADLMSRSYSILGLVPGIIVTLAVASSCLYTSLVLWRYCLKHPELRDICDIGQKLFGGSQIAYNITCLFFMLNNTFIQGKIKFSKDPLDRLIEIQTTRSPSCPCWSKAIQYPVKFVAVHDRVCRDIRYHLLRLYASSHLKPTVAYRYI